MRLKGPQFSLSVCMSVCPVMLFEPVTRYCEIQHGDHAAERDLGAYFQSRTFSHPKMTHVQTSEVDVKYAVFQLGPRKCVC